MKKLDVNQELCRKVQIMLAGAKSGEVAQLLGISKTTVSRIKMAGFDAETYKKNTEKRVAEENRGKPEEDLRFPMKVEEVIDTGDGILVKARQAEEQVQGQISMDDLQAEEQKEYVDLQIRVPKYDSLAIVNEQKLMRFLAGKFDNNAADVAALAQWIVKVNSTLEKINDNLCQILRKLDG